MKIYYLLLLSVILLGSGCVKDDCTNTQTYIQYEPVYVLKEDFRALPIQNAAVRPLQKTGKMYFYGKYILINEQRDGIHVIDNTNPSAPTPVTFLEIPGNVDISVSNSILYVDSYSDLLSIDISDITNIRLLQRKIDVFPLLHSSKDRVLAYYKETDIRLEIDCNSEFFGRTDFQWNGNFFLNAQSSSADSGFGNAGNSSSPQGLGGSMARFTISKGHLYCIDKRFVNTFLLNSAGDLPDPLKTDVGHGIETLFPYKDYLFVGADNGMHILSINQPHLPVYLSKFEHAQACDPVVVQGDLAYVTLRDGNTCQGYTNQLEVIDVKNVLQPKLLKTYKMSNPHGLSVHDNTLYLCEGSHGLKTFDITNHMSINQLSHMKGFDAFDVILIPNVSLLLIGKDGFRQYDYSNPNDLKLLSHLPIQL